MKFRLWDQEYNKWLELPEVYGDYQNCAFRTYGEPFSIKNFFNNDTQHRIKEGLIIVQQSTEILDKNGKEIFEGDIIDITCRGAEKRRLKKICKNGSRFYTVHINGHWKPGVEVALGNWIFEYEDREVIGNIFENSELMNHEI